VIVSTKALFKYFRPCPRLFPRHRLPRPRRRRLLAIIVYLILAVVVYHPRRCRLPHPHRLPQPLLQSCIRAKTVVVIEQRTIMKHTPQQVRGPGHIPLGTSELNRTHPLNIHFTSWAWERSHLNTSEWKELQPQNKQLKLIAAETSQPDTSDSREMQRQNMPCNLVAFDVCQRATLELIAVYRCNDNSVIIQVGKCITILCLILLNHGVFPFF
jgi:hypothetical protein